MDKFRMQYTVSHERESYFTPALGRKIVIIKYLNDSRLESSLQSCYHLMCSQQIYPSFPISFFLFSSVSFSSFFSVLVSSLALLAYGNRKKTWGKKIDFSMKNKLTLSPKIFAWKARDFCTFSSIISCLRSSAF